MIISIKSSASGGSSRGLINYLAHSKLDKAQEEVEKREFFNESENDLDVKRANENLSLTGAKPNPEELLHLVIAPGKEEIESVGDDLQARKEALKVLVRETVAQLEKEVKAKKLKWVAVTHFNTDHPHAHLALQKEFIDETGRIESLRITRQMLHYNESGENGEKTLHKGVLILAAENKLKEIAAHRQKTQENNISPKADKAAEKSKTQGENQPQVPSEPTKIPNYPERRILAEEMLVTAEIARRTRNIENLIEHGDKKRFKIKDEETENVRHVSIFDIEQKIEIVSRQKSWALYPKNPDKRSLSISLIANEERAKHLPVITQLETIRRHVLGFENRHLTNAEEKHTRLHNQKLMIEKKYEGQNTTTPLPIFTPSEIQQLQTEAIRNKNVEKILLLENIRQKNALELRNLSRRDEDVQELLATKIVAAFKLEAAEKRLLEFPKTKDFIKVKIGNSVWSSHSLEQNKNQNDSKNGLFTKFKAKTIDLFFGSEKKNSADEITDYRALKTQVSDALENLENERRSEIQKQKEFVQTLDKIFQAETNPNKAKLTPSFSAFELAEMEDFAFETIHESLYEKSLQWQENWLLQKLASRPSESTNDESPKMPDKVELSGKAEFAVDRSNKAKKIIGNFVLGRAEARMILATAKIAKAGENIARYHRDKVFFKHQIKDAKTGATRELSLRDVDPKTHYYLLDSILNKALETKEQKQERDAVQQAAQNKEKELTLDLQNARIAFLRLENHKTELLEKYKNEQTTGPIFTPKEIGALEAWKYQTMKSTEAERIEKIINQAEKSSHIERIQDLLKGTANELKDLIPNLSNKPEIFSPVQNLSIKELQTTAYQVEFSNQNQARQREGDSSQSQAKTNIIEHEKMEVKEKGRAR